MERPVVVNGFFLRERARPDSIRGRIAPPPTCDAPTLEDRRCLVGEGGETSGRWLAKNIRDNSCFKARPLGNGCFNSRPLVNGNGQASLVCLLRQQIIGSFDRESRKQNAKPSARAHELHALCLPYLNRRYNPKEHPKEQTHQDGPTNKPGRAQDWLLRPARPPRWQWKDVAGD
jgi:hypothetical protein